MKNWKCLFASVVIGCGLASPQGMLRGQTVERDTTITGPRGRSIQRQVEVQRNGGTIDRSIQIKRPGGTFERQVQVQRRRSRDVDSYRARGPARRSSARGPW